MHIHISGLAYKVVNNHHRTMLSRHSWISWAICCAPTMLVLQETTHTKGVASVHSPIQILVQSSASVMHGAFVDAVIESSRKEHAVDEQPCFVHGLLVQAGPEHELCDRVREAEQHLVKFGEIQGSVLCGNSCGPFPFSHYGLHADHSVALLRLSITKALVHLWI
ncbi:hypothetical protein JVT61DRAFT_3927 [Boletus reticuloceps]|uniref:Uncharacterized protein n=1 Tax=Boletus reticuloceps TaxID=495285 RepID=A0A8I2YKZ4_9AGAM|nr:hypothetical protein JVT61DRAFT_3927 [Boletus reticuloceps]